MSERRTHTLAAVGAIVLAVALAACWPSGGGHPWPPTSSTSSSSTSSSSSSSSSSSTTSSSIPGPTFFQESEVNDSFAAADAVGPLPANFGGTITGAGDVDYWLVDITSAGTLSMTCSGGNINFVIYSLAQTQLSSGVCNTTTTQAVTADVFIRFTQTGTGSSGYSGSMFVA